MTAIQYFYYYLRYKTTWNIITEDILNYSPTARLKYGNCKHGQINLN